MDRTQVISVAVVGDAFVDILCCLGEDLPMWGGDMLLTGGVNLKPGGSAVSSHSCFETKDSS